MKSKRLINYTVSLDRDLVKRFRAACERRGRGQSWVIARMMRYYLAHRYAFNNGVGQRRREVKRKVKEVVAKS